MKKFSMLLILIALMLALVVPANAQEPSVSVSDQLSLNGTVTIDSVVSVGAGWLVVHTDNGGSPGPVAGYAHLHDGLNSPVVVQVDASIVTPMLFAMLHTDTGEAGVYEFGTVEGADGPVRDGAGNVITPPFNVQLIAAAPQFVDGSFSATAVTDAAGWLVIHQGVDGAPGPVLGAAPLVAGNNNVTVDLEGEVTTTVFPMLHVDTGEAGVYEFGTVEGADGPVRVNGKVAVTGVSTAPAIVMWDQVVVHSDGYEMMDMGDDMMMGPSVTAKYVLSEGPGWLVIHSDGGGSPGPVLGAAPLVAGLNTNVTVELDVEALTTTIFPMLHVDTGTEGTYEFGTVEGADGPVRVNDQVVVFPLAAAPSFAANEQAISEEGTLTIAKVLTDAPGWIVIHSSIDGAPGPVVGYAPVNRGLNTNIVVSVDLSSVDGAATDQVFPMLHVDTGVSGAYEFGTVEGADGPVRVAEQVVVGPLGLTAGE